MDLAGKSSESVDLDEGDFSRSSTRCRSTDSAEVPLVQGLELGQGGLARGVQLCRNVDNEGGKYSKMIAGVCLPSSEPTLLQSPPCPNPPITVRLVISTNSIKARCSDPK